MKNSNSAWSLLFVWLVFALGAGIGYVMNIITLCQSSVEPLTGVLIARVAGIFVAPLGCILGWF